MTSPLPDIELSEELIRKFDKLDPRYTSYPTADRFSTGFTEKSCLDHLTQCANWCSTSTWRPSRRHRLIPS